MKNAANTLRITKEEIREYNNSVKSIEILRNEKSGKIKSRLGFVYFVALVTSVVVLFLR